MQVQFDEDASSTELLRGGWDQKKRIVVLPHLSVEGSMVDAWLQGSVLFYHKEEAGSGRGFRWLDELLTKCYLYVVMAFFSRMDRGYTRPLGGRRSIAQSHGR